MYATETIDKLWLNKSLDADFLLPPLLNKSGIYSDLIAVAIISDLLEVYKEYIPIFNLWADAESKLADPLHAMANAFDKNSSALKTLVRVSLRRCFVDDKVLSQ